MARRILAGVAALAVVMAACGGDDDAAEPDSNPDDNSAEAQEEAVDPDGVLRVGYDLVSQGAGGVHLDPGEINNNTRDSLLYLVFGRLMRPTADGGLEPDLAESASVVDETTIDVVIREGVTFHDGEPFDAEAVKEGLERTLASGNESGLTTRFLSLESVEVTGPNAVRLHIPDGTAASWFGSFLGSWQTTIVRPDTNFEHPLGAGPMRVVDYQPEQSLVLEKYEDYWDSESIKLGGMEFVHVSTDQPQSGIAALRADQIDVVTTDATQLPGLGDDIEVLAEPDPSGLITVQLCKRDGPLASAEVRRAINQAIDREAISEAAYQGAARPATQMWPEGHRFYNDDVADMLAYDPDAARSNLEEAGYGDGFSFDFYFLPALGLPDVAQLMQQQLAEVGVTANLISADNYVDDFLNPPRDGAGLIPGGSEGREKLDQWIGDSLGNTCAYDDPELTSLSQQLSTVSATSDAAIEAWHQLGEQIVGDALSVFVVFRSHLGAYDPATVGGLEAWPIGNIVVPSPFTTFVRADS